MRPLKCDYCDQRATTLAGDTNGVLVCEDHVRLFAEREIAAAIDATQPPAAPETDVRVPTCSLGYPREQLEQLLAEDFAAFAHWMRGQTMAICDGRRYDHDAREYQPTGCGPHGVVVYPWDLDNYLRGGRIND